jgi:hypothetical protein
MGGSNERTGPGQARADDETGIPTAVARLDAGQVLCDRHRKECFVVREVAARGTRLEQDGEEFFVPHSLLAPWVDSRLFAVEESESADLPDWLSTE